MDIVWLVLWTGSGAVIVLRQYAILTRLVDDRTLRLEPLTAWSVSDSQVRPMDWHIIDKTELGQALKLAERKLVAVGCEGGVTIRAFRRQPVHYDPYRAREFWIGQIGDLRDQLYQLGETHLPTLG